MMRRENTGPGGRRGRPAAGQALPGERGTMLRMGHERGLLSTPGATKAMPSPNKKQRPRTVVLGWLKSGRNDRHSGLKFSQAAFKTHPFQILETGYTGPINEATPSVASGP